MEQCQHPKTNEICTNCGRRFALPAYFALRVRGGRTVSDLESWVPEREFEALVEAVASEELIEPGPDRVVSEVAIAKAARELVQAVLERGRG